MKRKFTKYPVMAGTNTVYYRCDVDNASPAVIAAQEICKYLADLGFTGIMIDKDYGSSKDLVIDITVNLWFNSSDDELRQKWYNNCLICEKLYGFQPQYPWTARYVKKLWSDICSFIDTLTLGYSGIDFSAEFSGNRGYESLHVEVDARKAVKSKKKIEQQPIASATTGTQSYNKFINEWKDAIVCQVNDEDFQQMLWGDAFREVCQDKMYEQLKAEGYDINDPQLQKAVVDAFEGYGGGPGDYDPYSVW